MAKAAEKKITDDILEKERILEARNDVFSGQLDFETRPITIMGHQFSLEGASYSEKALFQRVYRYLDGAAREARIRQDIDLDSVDELTFYEDELNEVQDKIKAVLKDDDYDRLTKRAKLDELTTIKNEIKAKIKEINVSDLEMINEANKDIAEFRKELMLRYLHIYTKSDLNYKEFEKTATEDDILKLFIMGETKGFFGARVANSAPN